MWKFKIVSECLLRLDFLTVGAPEMSWFIWTSHIHCKVYGILGSFESEHLENINTRETRVQALGGDSVKF